VGQIDGTLEIEEFIDLSILGLWIPYDSGLQYDDTVIRVEEV